MGRTKKLLFNKTLELEKMKHKIGIILDTEKSNPKKDYGVMLSSDKFLEASLIVNGKEIGRIILDYQGGNDWELSYEKYGHPSYLIDISEEPKEVKGCPHLMTKAVYKDDTLLGYRCQNCQGVIDKFVMFPHLRNRKEKEKKQSIADSDIYKYIAGKD